MPQIMPPKAPLSVIIPTLNAAKTLPATLHALTPGAHLIRETLVVDGGSTDGTQTLASLRTPRVLRAPRGRGHQLHAGAQSARAPWLLFLHADTTLAPDWAQDVHQFLSDPQKPPNRAAVFRFALDDPSRAARAIARGVHWRCRLLALPYGDQGLLIPKSFYTDLGGFPPWPLMEDVHLIRRIGRRRLTVLHTTATTSPHRYLTRGYPRQVAANSLCLLLYFLGVSPVRLARFYGYDP